MTLHVRRYLVPLAFAALAVGIVAACDLNPQPLPPGETENSPTGGNSGNGGMDAATGGGDLGNTDAAAPAAGDADSGPFNGDDAATDASSSDAADGSTTDAPADSPEDAPLDAEDGGG